MSLPSAPNARSATSPSSGEVHARRSVRCSLNSLAVSARSSPGTASGSCSSRPRTTRGARHERGRQSPPHSSPRSRASDENREREEEEEEEVAKEETVASSQSPLRVRIPSVWSRDLELYLEDPFLGSGAFATILQTTHRSSGQGLALKVMNRTNFVMRGIEHQLDAEIEAMRRCVSCRHLVRLFDVVEEHDHVYLQLELCEGDLLRYTSLQPSSCLSEMDAATWSRQMFLGLQELHSLGIFHRDIKPENLLYTTDRTLKIADFGWCAEVRETPCSLAGTFQYMAPEILTGLSQTEAVDVWSGGLSILQLMMAKPLLTTFIGPGATNLTVSDPEQATKMRVQWLVTEIFVRCPLSDGDRPEHVSPECWDLHQKVLVPEPRHRLPVAEALLHTWLEPKNRERDREHDLEASSDQPSLPSPRNLAETWAPSEPMPGPGRSPAPPLNLPRSRCKTPLSAHGAPVRRGSRPSSCSRSEMVPVLGLEADKGRVVTRTSRGAARRVKSPGAERTAPVANVATPARNRLPQDQEPAQSSSPPARKPVRPVWPQFPGPSSARSTTRSRGSEARRQSPQARPSSEACRQARPYDSGDLLPRRPSSEARPSEAQIQRLTLRDEALHCPFAKRPFNPDVGLKGGSLKGIAAKHVPEFKGGSVMVPGSAARVVASRTPERNGVFACSRRDRENLIAQMQNSDSKEMHLRRRSPMGRPHATVRVPSPSGSLLLAESLQRSPRPPTRTRPTTALEQYQSTRHLRANVFASAPRTPVVQMRASAPATPQIDHRSLLLDRRPVANA